MMKRIYKNIAMLAVLVAGGSALADQPQQSWLEVYQSQATVSARAQSAPIGKKVHYQGTQALLSSQLVQQLTGMGTPTRPGTILSSRLLASLSGIDSSLLPDGSTLATYLGAWAQSYVPDVSLYAITYRSQGVNGAPTKVSGLVVVPENSTQAKDPDAVLVYMHATTTQDNNAPSERSQEAYAVITAFTHPGAVLAMPDYLGYGANKGNHPYAMGELNAPAGRSMIIATRELMKKLKRPVGNQVFITGYSEGGGNALWLTRYLEERGEANLLPTRSAPMSGPYDLSGATARSFIGSQPPLTFQENFASKPTLLSFAGVSTAKIIKQPVNSLLQDPLAQEAKGQFPGKLSDTNLGVRLLTTAINDLAYVNYATLSPNPQNLLQPGLVTAIQQHDLSNPAIRLWSQNDNLDWTPQAPVMLFGILQDELVPFASSTYPVPASWKTLTPPAIPAPYAEGNAENLMVALRAQGIGADRVGWTAFNGAVQSLTSPVVMNHAAGMLPCSILAQSYLFSPAIEIPQLSDPLRQPK
jgi:acetyl esterase/lipase